MKATHSSYNITTFTKGKLNTTRKYFLRKYLFTGILGSSLHFKVN